MLKSGQARAPRATPEQIRARAEYERRRRSRLEGFVNAYYNDRVGFLYDIFDWDHPNLNGDRPAPYQEEIVAGFDRQDRWSVRGPHGLGKTAMVSWLVWHWALTREAAQQDWKCITTASVWRQLSVYLWPEIHKWERLIRWDRVPIDRPILGRELLDRSLKLTFGSATAVASDNATAIEGAHADQLFYIFDESKAISEATFDAAEGAFSNAGTDTTKVAKVLAVSTPGAPQGRFYDIQKKKAGFEDWRVRHVTLGECVRAGRISKAWAQARARQWGVGDPKYLNRVLGEFSETTEDGVIPHNWVEAAFLRYESYQFEVEVGLRSEGTLIAIGQDVSDSGRDDTTMCDLYLTDDNMLVVKNIRTIAKDADGQSLMKASSALVRAARAYPQDVEHSLKLVIDGLGNGAGVVQRVREVVEDEVLNASVMSYKASVKAKDPRDEYIPDRTGELHFRNLRSLGWWTLRDMLDPFGKVEIAIERNERLLSELIAPTYREMSDGIVQIESKESLRKRLGYSTDFADCVIHALMYDSEALEQEGIWVIG